MRLQIRNTQTVYYCQYDRKEPRIGDDGYETGEYNVFYKTPIPILANVSPSSGTAQLLTFGTFINYDRVLLSDDVDCEIDEDCVLFVDKAPEYDDYGQPLYDYTVRAVGRSLNVLSVAIKKVKVS